jgi:hypothetical protein
MLAAWLASGCSKNEDNCPGLCPDETATPTMTIKAADGAASIASAKVVSGPCTAILLRSEGEVGVPSSYAEVQVSYHWPTNIPPLCIVEVTSKYGQVESVSVQAKSKAYAQPCCPYGTCCPKTQDALTERYHMEFDPKVATVSFPPPPDGGTYSDAHSDANDAPATDNSQGMDSLGLDGAPADGAALDAAQFDADDLDTAAEDVSIDVSDELDLATGT